MRWSKITVEPGALDGIPAEDMARFLAQYGREMVFTADGLTIRTTRGGLEADEPIGGKYEPGEHP